MQEELKIWIDKLLRDFGFHSLAEKGWDLWIVFFVLLFLAWVFDWCARFLIVRTVRRIVQRTHILWDDELFSTSVLKHTCHVLSLVLLSSIVPMIVERPTLFQAFLIRVIDAGVILSVFYLVNALLQAAFQIVGHRPSWQNKPIKGLRQTGQGIALLITVILVISTLLNRSPRTFFAGLGASAAIILLIFKDSILGFVSGIQLSANDMLQVGDWIEMDKFGVDGTVTEVTLTTVKVQNFDNTIVTLPPYLLVSDSFQNWQAMKHSGGRRIMRSVWIDLHTIRFVTPQMLARFRKIRHIASYLDKQPIPPTDLTNLALFRIYLLRFLKDDVHSHPSMRIMVRELESSEKGLPLQLYFFTNTVDWMEYEQIQCTVFEHIFAMIGQFDLKVFQAPTGEDLRKVGSE